MGQLPPLTAGFVEIKHGVHKFALAVNTQMFPPILRFKHRLYHIPLLYCQITIIFQLISPRYIVTFIL